MDDITRKLYFQVSKMPRYTFNTPVSGLPCNGIYAFFEVGETFQIDGDEHDRIVRIGTHIKDNRLRNRIRQHYGNKHSLKGNKNGSVFRKHLGGALMRRDNPKDSRLVDWLTQNGLSFLEVEEKVSYELRNNFTFTCWPVNTGEERLTLEKGLVALLSRHPIGSPTKDWLGNYAYDTVISRCGIWNVQHTDGVPLSELGIVRLEELRRS